MKYNRYYSGGTAVQLTVQIGLLTQVCCIQTVFEEQQFDCVLCCSISTVAVMQQKAQTVLRYAKFKSIVCVKYEFRYDYCVRPSEN